MSYLIYQGKLIQNSHKYLSGVASSIFPEVIVGTQTWMQFNADVNIPGSLVYDDNEANRSLYGGLYNYADLATVAAAYPGFRIPTISDYQTMSTFLGGDSISGDKIKETGTTYWTSNSGTNTSGWGARGGGIGYGVGNYVSLKTDGYFLTTDPGNLMAVFAGFPQMYPSWSYLNTYYFSVRLIKI